MSRSVFVLAAMSIAGQVSAITLYENTTINPTGAYGNLDPNVVMLDDVLIPKFRAQGLPRLVVRKATVDLYTRVSGTYTVKAWIAEAGYDQSNNLVAVFPPTQVGTAQVNSGGLGRKQVVFGDGTNPLFTTGLLTVQYQTIQYRTFFFGLSFDQPLNKIGWTLADGPDTNLNGMFAYYGQGSSQNGFKVFGGGLKTSFNLKLEGYPVPEPTTWLVLVSGLAACVTSKRRVHLSRLFRARRTAQG